MKTSFEKSGSGFYPNLSHATEPKSHFTQFHQTNASTNLIHSAGFVMNPSSTSIQRNLNTLSAQKTDHLQSTVIQSHSNQAQIIPKLNRVSSHDQQSIRQVESVLVRKNIKPDYTPVKNSKFQRYSLLEEIKRPQYQRLYSMPKWERRQIESYHEKIKKKTFCIPFCCILWALLGLIAVILGMLFGLGIPDRENQPNGLFGANIAIKDIQAGSQMNNIVFTEDKDKKTQQEENSSNTRLPSTSFMYPIKPDFANPIPAKVEMKKKTKPAQFQNWKVTSIKPEEGIPPKTVPYFERQQGEITSNMSPEQMSF